jgi:ABC-type sulfate transport system permease component
VRRSPATLAVLSGLLAIYLIAPFGAGLAQIGISDWGSTDLAGLASACVVSLGSATVATAMVAICGVPLGCFLARRSGRGMALLGFVVQLPLALPPLASGVLLLFLLGYSSPLGRLTDGALTDSFYGIVLAEAFVAAPFLIIAARSAFAAIGPVLEDVAATLGHLPWAVFLRVSLPLAWRAIAAGMLLAWLRAFGEFGATVMVAYHPFAAGIHLCRLRQRRFAGHDPGIGANAARRYWRYVCESVLQRARTRRESASERRYSRLGESEP